MRRDISKGGCLEGGESWLRTVGSGGVLYLRQGRSLLPLDFIQAKMLQLELQYMRVALSYTTVGNRSYYSSLQRISTGRECYFCLSTPYKGRTRRRTRYS